MNTLLDNNAREILFSAARSHAYWLDKNVSEQQLRELYDLAKWGPTSMNSLPVKLLFVKSAHAKERLKPALAEGNVDKVMSAPVTAIIAHDLRFYEHLPETFAHMQDAKSLYEGNAALIESTAFRNATLQAAYVLMAARALGLDVGPLSGFDNAVLDAEFFPQGRYKSNFLMNIGYGDRQRLHPRGPRLAFERVCNVL